MHSVQLIIEVIQRYAYRQVHPTLPMYSSSTRAARRWSQLQMREERNYEFGLLFDRKLDFVLRIGDTSEYVAFMPGIVIL